ncbi:hypothetical protein [Streptomyces sp. NPDC002851]
MTIGVGALHCVLPALRVPVDELPEFAGLDREEREFVRGSGISAVGVLPDTTAGDLAARACRELLAVQGTGVARPDTVLLVAPRAPDVLLGSGSCRVQAEAGLAGGVLLHARRTRVRGIQRRLGTGQGRAAG